MIDTPPLPLVDGFTPAKGRFDFLPSLSNREALSWIEQWPDWPATAGVLVGPEGSGKSHLSELWSARAGAAAVAADRLIGASPHRVLDTGRSLLVEDADRLKTDEAVLFHLFNMVRERRGHVLFTARTRPAFWPLRLPDLRSRLAGAMLVEIQSPDDALLAGVLVKLFEDRHLLVTPPAVDYALARMKRSFAAAQALTEILDQLAYDRHKREANLSLMRRALEILEKRLSQAGTPNPTSPQPPA